MKGYSCKTCRPELIITDSNFGDAQPLDAVSKRISSSFKENKDVVLVITGFIGSNTTQKLLLWVETE
jgi:aspartokinase